MADFGSELEAFRAEARAWLETNHPASMRGGGGLLTVAVDAQDGNPDAEIWRQRLVEKGWGTPSWPREYGGGGLTPAQARVLSDEMADLGAVNPVAGFGPDMLGPLLLEMGTDSQKRRHLPPIARDEIRWCQGYSEPGAGSDLASLQTRCEDAGDHWVVNGQKIWTSGAHLSDWCFCLVRTDPQARKHDGISFVLIDMHQSGVDPRPIRLIGGSSSFCETFFTDARVEKDDMVGPLNGGWAVGKRLLQFERSNQGSRGLGEGVSLAEVAKQYVGTDEAGRIADLDLRSRLAAHLMRAQAHSLTLRRAQAEAQGKANLSATTSIMKNSGTWNAQERAELAVEIMGHQGLGWEGDGFEGGELDAVRAWLGSKAMTIYGGSQEIQNNIVSKRILGLPDLTSQSGG